VKQDPLDPRPLFVDPKIGGGLTALRIANGEKIWFSPPIVCAPRAKPGCSPAQSQAVTAIPGVVFSGSLDGHLRAYSAKREKSFGISTPFVTIKP
jgi:polyvinyl alcohol dehydrogenase (cytochrome)